MLRSPHRHPDAARGRARRPADILRRGVAAIGLVHQRAAAQPLSTWVGGDGKLERAGQLEPAFVPNSPTARATVDVPM